MSLTGCLKKAGEYLPAEDRAAILRASQQFRSEGMGTAEAAKAAVEQRIAAVREMLTPKPVAAAAARVADGEGALNQSSAGPGFYSALSRAVEGASMKAAPAGGWKDAIKGWVAKGQVKADEVEWSGVNEWLDLQQGKVAREAVAEYLDANGVKVTETVLGVNAGTHADATRKQYIAAMIEQGAAPDEAADLWGHMARFSDDERSGFDEDKKDRGFALVVAAGLSGNEIHDAFYDDKQGVDDPKYANYTLPGGTNYREVLLTLPVPKPAVLTELPAGYSITMNRLQGPETPFTVTPDAQMHGQPFAGFHATEQEAIDAAVARLNREAERSTDGQFKSTHWDQPNVLAHIRLNDRTDASGARVLFVEEVQSDWGQDGKKRGLNRKATPQEVAREVYGQDFAAMDADMQAGVMLEVDARNEGIGGAAGNGGGLVPNAPFVGKTDAWVALALKRVIKLAVDGGYDKVAFVTGEQSADRYDLSKQVSRVRWASKPGANAGKLTVKDLGGNTVLRERTAGPLETSELEDFVGKDVARKLIESQPTSTTPYGDEIRELSGLDLKVGGEGMKAFYDRIVPAVAKDVLRKLGGGAMETVDMDVRKLPSVPLVDGMPAEAPGFAITGAMKAKASTGVPLFQGDKAPRAQIQFGVFRVYDSTGNPLGYVQANDPRQALALAKAKTNDDGSPKFPTAARVDTNQTFGLISLLEGADKSSFIHESGHAFLEIQAELARRVQARIDAGEKVTPGQQGILDDMNRILTWFGITGYEQASGPTGGTMDQPAYHGTPHRGIDKFSTDAIGTGEGNQSYGWGLYFATKKAIAEHYRAALSSGYAPSIIKDGQELSSAAEIAEAYYTTGRIVGGHGGRDVVLDFERDGPYKWSVKVQHVDADGNPVYGSRPRWHSTMPDFKDLEQHFKSNGYKVVRGQLYEVDIPEDSEMLLWDKPLSEQPEKVRAALNSARVTPNKFRKHLKQTWPGERVVTGERLYRALSLESEPAVAGPTGGGDRIASEVLMAAGIKGIKYLDGTSRSAGDGSYNYVIFSGDDVAIRQTFYQGGPEITPPRVPPTGRTSLDTWSMMSLKEREHFHEMFARGFEQYTMEGQAPSLELQGAFNNFRKWLVAIYKKLANLNVNLTDDVRAVMGRMLASDAAIEEAEAARSLHPMIRTAEDAAKLGWSKEKFDAYQLLAQGPTDEAIKQLQTRGMKDMQWLSGARDRAIREKQQANEGLRREVRQEVRAEVYSEPVYRAWQFLTGRGEEFETATAAAKKKTSRGVDPTTDSLLVAIAKLGGISRKSAKADLSVSDDDLTMKSEVFGGTIFSKSGGRNADSMRETLTELGYLHSRDEFGRTDLRGLADAISNEIGGSPEYSFAKDYSEGPRDEIADFQVYGKLNTADLKSRYGESETAVWRKLSALRMTNEKGLDADVVADAFGFDSGDALVQALASAMPPREVIEARTDARMLETYGDINSPQALAKAADEAVFNRLRAKFLTREWKALEDATTKKEKVGKRHVDVMAQAARKYAADLVGRLKIREIKPNVFAASMVRNGKAAERAFMAGKTAEAAMHKRNQAVNAYATQAAYSGLAEVEKHRTYLKKFDKRLKSIDPKYQDQIEGLLVKFDFRKSSIDEAQKARAEATTAAQIKAAEERLAELDALGPTQEREGLAQWLEKLGEYDVKPDLSDVSQGTAKSYRDMTIDEMRDLVDDIKRIEHLGRLKNRLLMARDKREFDAVKADVIEAISASKKGERRPYRLETGDKTMLDRFNGFLTEHRKLSSLIREIDQGNDDGPLYNAIGRSMNAQDAWEQDRNEKVTKRLLALLDPLLKMPGGLSGDKSKVPIPAIGTSMTRQGRISVVLNYGNEDGRQRLMSGKLKEGNENWTDGQIRAVMETLSPQELQTANEIWALLDKFWPEIAAKEERVNGVAPEKVEAAPFTVKANDGTLVQMRGGYYPLKYDRSESASIATKDAKALAEEAMRGATTRSTTRRGHTKERVDGVKHKLRLDLNVIPEHVQEVVHDLAWHEWLIDANKIFRDDEVAQALSDYYGAEVRTNIQAALQAIAGGDRAARDHTTDLALMLRSNVSRAVMGWSLTTAFLQPFGLLQSMARNGVGNVLSGMGRFLGTPKHMSDTLRMIGEKSPMMRHRAITMNRELYEISKIVRGKSKAMRVFDASLFMLTTKLQAVADVPTWLGAYNKALQEKPQDEQRAIDLADRAVIEAQGSGSTKDLAKVQRDHPFLTQFMSYFSAGYQIAVEKTKFTDFRNPAAVAGWAADMALLAILPAIIPNLIMHLLKGGGDDEPEELAKKMLQWQAQFLLAPIVGAREFAGVVGGFDYAGPPAARIVVDTTRLYKQAAQGDVLERLGEGDDKLLLPMFLVAGDLTGIPTAQLARSYKGWKAWEEGEQGAGPQSVLFGPPPKP